MEIRAQPFPWNDVRLDGRSIMTLEGVTQRAGGSIVPMAAGAHEVEYVWKPDPLWRGLNRVSRIILFGWVVSVLVVGARTALRQSGKTAPDPDHF